MEPCKETDSLRHVVSSCHHIYIYIGDLDYKNNRDLDASKQSVTAKPDISETLLGPNDEFLVLACDGVWECHSSDEVIEFVSKTIKSSTSSSDIKLSAGMAKYDDLVCTHSLLMLTPIELRAYTSSLSSCTPFPLLYSFSF